jgi:hypothetical protein
VALKEKLSNQLKKVQDSDKIAVQQLAYISKALKTKFKR